MFATRCKLRRPGAVTKVGSSCISLARPGRARARCLGTAASPEGEGRDEDGKGDEGDGSARYQGPYRQKIPRYQFAPQAYEPMPLSYADILSRAISTPIVDSRRILNQIRRSLPPQSRDPSCDSSSTEDATLQPEGASQRLEHVLDRSLHYLETSSARIQGVLSAVTKDVSCDALPKAYSQDFAPIRAHHLGRWYLKKLAVKTESGPIKWYLHHVALATEKARNIIISHSLESIDKTLRVQEAALGHAIRQHRRELEAVVYAMVCELRAARRAQQWHKVWMLERKVASTASNFLRPRPLRLACGNLLNRDDEKMTEISMSRMAEWNDSYKQMYEEDVGTRKKMNLVKRYWAVLMISTHEKPWQGEADIFEAKSATKNAKELIVIRHDQSGTPSPLWPRIWRPALVGVTNDPIRKIPHGAARTIKQRTLPTPGGTGWRSKCKEKRLIGKGIKETNDNSPRSEGKSGKGPRSEIQQQPSPSMHANSDVHEV